MQSAEKKPKVKELPGNAQEGTPTDSAMQIKLAELIQMKEFLFLPNRVDLENGGLKVSKKHDLGSNCGSCGGGGGSCRF